MGNIRLVRKFRIFFAVLFAIEWFLGNELAMSLCLMAYMATLYVGVDMMERVFIAAIEEGESENENGARQGVGRVDEPQAGPRAEDEPEGGPR